MNHSEGTVEVPFYSGITWRIRESFVRYVLSSGGEISASAGAAVQPDGVGSWPLISIDQWDGSRSAGLLQFGGQVRFSAHFGALDVRLTDPALTLDGGSSVLWIGRDDARVRLAQFQLARLDAPPGHDVWYGTEGVLAPEATGVFGSVYPAGTPLDPYLLALKRSL